MRVQIASDLVLAARLHHELVLDVHRPVEATSAQVAHKTAAVVQILNLNVKFIVDAVREAFEQPNQEFILEFGDMRRIRLVALLQQVTRSRQRVNHLLKAQNYIQRHWNIFLSLNKPDIVPLATNEASNRLYRPPIRACSHPKFDRIYS